MFFGVLSFNISNVDGFDDDVYDYEVGVGYEYVCLVLKGLDCVCYRCVYDVPNLSKGMVCVYVIKYVIIVSIYESFILGGIGGGWYGTW